MIETTVLFFILRTRYGPPGIIKNAVVASSLTLPFVWFFFPALGLGWAMQTALAESFATIAEGGVYAALFPRLKLADAMLASLACNCISFGIGLALG